MNPRKKPIRAELALALAGVATVVLRFSYYRFLVPHLGLVTALAAGLAAAVATISICRLLGARTGDVLWGMGLALAGLTAYGLTVIVPASLIRFDGAMSWTMTAAGIGVELLRWIAIASPWVLPAGAMVGVTVVPLVGEFRERHAIARAAVAGGATALLAPVALALVMTVAPLDVPSGYRTASPWSWRVLSTNFRSMALFYPVGFAVLAWLASRREIRRGRRTSMPTRVNGSERNLPSLAFGLGAGLAILLVSAVPLVRFARDLIVARQIHRRYVVRPEILGYTTAFHGIAISVSDDLDPAAHGVDDRVPGPVRTTVGGRDYSLGNPVEIRPHHTDGNRYWTWIGLAEVTDRETGLERFVVVQRVDPNYPHPTRAGRRATLDDLRLRMLFLDRERTVSEETLGFGDRIPPLHRAILETIAVAGPPSRGRPYAVWPSLYLPLFPFLTGIAGIVPAVICGARLLRHGRKRIA